MTSQHTQPPGRSRSGRFLDAPGRSDASGRGAYIRSWLFMIVVAALTLGLVWFVVVGWAIILGP
jgi:hypothetical protein